MAPWRSILAEHDALQRSRPDRWGGGLAAALALALVSCHVPPPAHTGAAPPSDRAPALLAAYVVVGASGQALARAVIDGTACPALSVDGVAQSMALRSAPGAAPVRPSQSKPPVFPGVCEGPLRAGARRADVAGVSLPLPVRDITRVVVLGDTGCRIKASDHIFQDCASPASWPFAAIAAQAARERPDLVVHVGDYHYRESACPAGLGCAGSPWGYGWDAWSADFFVPARALLAAAPWVFTRGNHEECARAGQGWFRLLDAGPFSAARSCDLPAEDAGADFSTPYAVPLGAGWQLIVFDSARASRPLDPSQPRDAHALEQYRRGMAEVARLAAASGMHSIFVSHHPVLGFAVGPSAVYFGTPALLAAMEPLNGERYFPAGIELALHGHVHTFEAIDFVSDHPATIVAGHGGDTLDRELPPQIAASYPSAPGVQIRFAAHAHDFGYLLLERRGADWSVSARRVDGAVIAQCALHAAHLLCTGKAAVSRPPATEPRAHG